MVVVSRQNHIALSPVVAAAAAAVTSDDGSQLRGGKFEH